MGNSQLTLWVGLYVGWDRVSGDLQSRANSVHQVDGVLDMALTCQFVALWGKGSRKACALTGIEPTNFLSTGQCSIHWAIPASAPSQILFTIRHYWISSFHVSTSLTSVDGCGFFNFVVVRLAFNLLSDGSEWWLFHILVEMLIWLSIVIIFYLKSLIQYHFLELFIVKTIHSPHLVFFFSYIRCSLYLGFEHDLSLFFFLQIILTFIHCKHSLRKPTWTNRQETLENP